MKKANNINIERLFSIVWIVSLVCSLYILFWLVFMSFLTQSSISDKGINLTWLNFIVPHIFSVLLLGLYTKELFTGYTSISKKRNLFSLVSVLLSSLLVILTQFKFYIWIIDESSNHFFIVVPIILILTSIFGLTMHRMTNISLKKLN